VTPERVPRVSNDILGLIRHGWLGRAAPVGESFERKPGAGNESPDGDASESYINKLPETINGAHKTLMICCFGFVRKSTPW
jgi:hypothetical protein